MPIWPFSRRRPEPISAEELRDRLIAAAGTSPRRLRQLCRDYAELARASVGILIQAPEQLRGDDADPQAMQLYIQRLMAAAECLAQQGVPDVMQQLTGTRETNPILRWDDWLGNISDRMAALEHDKLVAEAREMICEAQAQKGSAPRLYEGYLRGRIGEALFHSGQIDAARDAFREALDYCRQFEDHDGVRTYLDNLKEVARYRGDTADAITWAAELAAHDEARGQQQRASMVRREIERLQTGTPACRIVCRTGEQTMELDEITTLEIGISYKFDYVRDRPALQKCVELTRRGKERAAEGNLSDALELFDEASEVDPYDPDPLYQSGVALMDLGAFDQAQERFDSVDQIAPGWFRCRFDRWLAGRIHQGAEPADVWLLLHGLEDLGLEPPQVRDLARQAVERHDDVAAFWLVKGDAERDTGDGDSAQISFRRGLECPLEPDIETRLLVSLATILEASDPQRRTLLEQAVTLNGNLFAAAVARVMLLMPAE